LSFREKNTVTGAAVSEDNPVYVVCDNLGYDYERFDDIQKLIFDIHKSLDVTYIPEHTLAIRIKLNEFIEKVKSGNAFITV
jgi:hypothetical protein